MKCVVRLFELHQILFDSILSFSMCFCSVLLCFFLNILSLIFISYIFRLF